MSSSSSDLVEPAAMVAASRRRHHHHHHHQHLPEEITIEILSRLPVKSLLRFKSVCKNWCALISNPSFITKHSTQTTTLSASNKHLITLTMKKRILKEIYAFCMLFRYKQQGQILDSASYIDQDFPFQDVSYEYAECPDFTKYVKIVGSCNGLVCVSLCGGLASNIVLWNPATRELRNLPEPGISIPQGEHIVSHCFCLGFGFDPYINDFKLVRLVCFTDREGPIFRAPPFGDGYIYSKITNVEVYSKITDSWKEIDVNVVECHVLEYSLYAVVSRGIHWLAKRSYNNNGRFIVFFDMGKEVFQEMPLPDSSQCGEIGNIEELGVVDDCLAFFVCPPRVDFNSINVWVMKEYGVTESWTKHSRIGPSITRSMWVTSGELILRGGGDGGIHLYKFDTQTFEKLFVLRDKCIFGVCTYMESLCSVKGGY